MTEQTLGQLLLLSLAFGGAIFAVTYGLGMILAGRGLEKGMQQRLVQMGGQGVERPLMNRTIEYLEKILLKTSIGQRMRTKLDAGDLQWTVLTLLALTIVLFIALYCALYLLLGLTFFVNMVLSTTATIGIVIFFLNERHGAYERALRDQISEVALLLSNSLRAGQSLYYALLEVEEKLPRPAGNEFHKLCRQIDLGKTMDDALRDFMHAHPSEEMRILITSLLIQRRAGGDLISTLASISSAIQARRQIRNEIDTITAEAKQTSVIVIILPFLILVIINRLSTNLVSNFLQEWYGIPFFLIVYALPQAVAFLLIRRVGNVQV